MIGVPDRIFASLFCMIASIHSIGTWWHP